MSKVEKMKHVQMDSPAVKSNPVLAEGTKAPRGPQVGESNLSDRDVVNLHATGEDFAAFRRSLDSQQASRARAGWRKLPGGSSVRASTVLAGCPGCGGWFWTEPRHVKAPCARCNFLGRNKLAILRPATLAEEHDWFVREQKRIDDFRASKPERDREVAEFNKRKFQDAR